jgi:hypothetical protein
MKRRSTAILAGIAVVAVYIASAAVSGRLSVLARRPLLEGTGPPPPYRWVDPPPDLAASNQKPQSLKVSIKLAKPEQGAGVYSTPDMQAVLVVEPGAFPGPETEILTLTITPLDPAKYPTPPADMTIAGNVYKVEALTRGGVPASPTGIAHFVLTYPLIDARVFSSRHTLLSSPDGQTPWTALKGSDSPAAQQVAADVTTLGFFAVGTEKPPAAKKKSGPSAGVVIIAVVSVIGAGVVALTVRQRRLAARRRRRQREARRRTRPRGP